MCAPTPHMRKFENWPPWGQPKWGVTLTAKKNSVVNIIQQNLFCGGGGVGGGEKQWAVFCTCTNKQVTKNVILLCSKYRDIFRNGPVRKYFSPKIRGGGQE